MVANREVKLKLLYENSPPKGRRSLNIPFGKITGSRARVNCSITMLYEKKMITDEKKNRIESLTDEEMSYEINLGRRSRFQRESFAYLQTCYQQRKNEKEKHDAMMRAFHKVPLAHELEVMPDIDLAELQSQLAPDSPGKIIVENEWQRRKSSKIPKLATNPAVNNLKLQNLI